MTFKYFARKRNGKKKLPKIYHTVFMRFPVQYIVSAMSSTLTQVVLIISWKDNNRNFVHIYEIVFIFKTLVIFRFLSASKLVILCLVRFNFNIMKILDEFLTVSPLNSVLPSHVYTCINRFNIKVTASIMDLN